MFPEQVNFENYYSPIAGDDERQLDIAYVRLLNASPKSPGINIFANGLPIARTFEYGSMTPYFPAMPGNYIIVGYSSGPNPRQLFREAVNISKGSAATLAAAGVYPNSELLEIPDPQVKPPPGKSLFRVVQLSPDTPRSFIRLKNGKTPFENLDYKEVTKYKLFNPGELSMELVESATKKVLYKFPNYKLTVNNAFTLYIIGLNRQMPHLSSLFVKDRG